MKSLMKNALVLAAITLVAGVLLGLVYEITKEPIALAKENAKRKAYQTVMPEGELFDTVDFEKKQAEKVLSKAGVLGCQIEEIVVAKTKEEVKGYVITTTSSEGYGGNIQVSVGIAGDGTVTGIEILSISETPGLGMNADTPDFKGQFAGKKGNPFVVTKTGAVAENEIDAISSATTTSNAVTNAVNAGVAYFQNMLVVGGSANE